MADATENLNPLTGKKRTVSDGTEPGDMTEAFHAAKTKADKLAVLKQFPSLQRHFRIDDYQ